MKKNHLQFTFDPTFSLQEMLSSLQWCIYQLVLVFLLFNRNKMRLEKKDV